MAVVVKATRRGPDLRAPRGRAQGRAAAFAVLVGLLLSVVVGGAAPAGAAPTTPVAPPAARSTTVEPAGATRYADSVFSAVDVHHDLTYGSAIGADGTEETLKLDLYEPVGDTLASRPAIVYIHGGTFAFGDKNEGATVATELAKHGYVVVSINYRLYPGDLGDVNRIAKGQGAAALDAKAAVRWLRRYAVAQRIDPKAIGAIGYSAGAITSLNLNYEAYLPGESGNPGFPANVEASVSLSGYAPHLEAGASPVLMFHGDQDTTVLYPWAVRTCTDTKTLGNACELVTYPGIAHNIYDRYSDWMPKAVAFYYANLVPHLTAPVAARYHPVTPTRLLDSRTAVGGWPGPLAAGAPRVLQVGDVAGVPAGASAVVMNVTATNASKASFLTVHPGGSPAPATSNLNFGAGETIANLVTVKLDAAGRVGFVNAVGTTDVVADLVGWYDYGVGSGDLFTGVTPSRYLDSRTTTGGWNGSLGAGQPRDLYVRQPLNAGGLPKTATAVVANITVTGATKGSFVTAWPSGTPQPTASALNFAPGQTIPNLAIIPLGAYGGIRLANAAGTVDVIVDVVGYFDPTTGSRFHAIDPTRVLDDRVGTGLSGPWGPGQSRALPLAGATGTSIPADATGVVANVTATAGTANSFVTVYPAGAPLPSSSNLNFGAGATIANLATVKVGADGAVAIANHAGSVDVIADAVGYYAAG